MSIFLSLSFSSFFYSFISFISLAGQRRALTSRGIVLDDHGARCDRSKHPEPPRRRKSALSTIFSESAVTAAAAGAVRGPALRGPNLVFADGCGWRLLHV